MPMLLDFLCRFAFGMAIGLVFTPATLVPGGFFRVNLLVVMGLTTFATLVAGGTLPSAWAPPAIAAVAAWMGSVAWLLERRTAGFIACIVAAIATAVAVWNGAGGDPSAACRHLLSGAVVGLSVHAMLLGHWYLNAPGMSVEALRRSIDVALVAWGLMLVVCAAEVAFPGATTSASTGSQTAAALLWLRWLAGLLGLPVLLWMSRETLRIPNTQSATGILYVACLASIVGELSGLLLAAG